MGRQGRALRENQKRSEATGSQKNKPGVSPLPGNAHRAASAAEAK